MEFLSRYSSTLSPIDAGVRVVQNYFDWLAKYSNREFVPGDEDDIDIRTYLLDFSLGGSDLSQLDEQVKELNRFYSWLQAEGIISRNPFRAHDFSTTPPLNENGGAHIPMQPPDPQERELKMLRSLTEIVEQLIGSVDQKSAIEQALNSVLKVMNLQTGWVSIRVDSGLGIEFQGKAPEHGFFPAAAAGLPPHLEINDRRALKQPPACQCQRMLMEGRLTRPVNIIECTRIKDSREVIGEDINPGYPCFHASVPLISAGKPIGIMNVATQDWKFFTNEDLRLLSLVSRRLVATLERANFYEQAESRRKVLENELRLAHQVQAGLMPQEMPAIPGFQIAWAWHPANEVAGDFYDIFPLTNGRWGIVMGDVADKGTAAALYMAMVHSLILSEGMRHNSPATVLREVNRIIFRQSPSGIFTTVFLGLLDPSKGELIYANAGHNPPIVRRSDGEIQGLDRTGHSVGVIKNMKIKESSITLMSADVLVLYTDGITESSSPRFEGEDYGHDRLVSAVRTAPRTASEILANIETELREFVGETPRDDDVTLLVLTKT
jgi:serine phosphatase RsbU (regulator of sigma subunit)